MNKKVIIVYGGSFNPPLNSHFSIAEHALNEYEEAEKVVFVPVSPKYDKQGLADGFHRYNMLKIETDKNERFLVSDIDINQKGSSLYTIDLMRIIEKKFPNNELWFLMGSDNLKEVPNWIGGEELISNYTLLIIERDVDKLKDIIEKSEFLKKYKNNIKILSEEIRSNFSSSYVRELIKNKKSIRYLLPDDVYDYIRNNNLYEN